MPSIPTLLPGKWAESALKFGLVGLSALWYLRNLIRFDTPQPAPQGHPHQAGAVPLSFGSFLPLWLDRVSRTFWAMPARKTATESLSQKSIRASAGCKAGMPRRPPCLPAFRSASGPGAT